MFATGVMNAVPFAGPNTPELFATSVNTLGVTTAIVLDFGKPFLKLGLVRLKLKHKAGSATTFTPYLFSKAGVTTAGNISQEYAGVSTTVATLFDPQLADAPVFMQTDELGRLYFVPGPNTGADNQFDYALRFLVYG